MARLRLRWSKQRLTTIRVEQTKADAQFVLQVIQTNNDPDKAAVNLRFLLDAGLISDQSRRSELSTYLEKREPGHGPSLPSQAASAASQLQSTLGRLTFLCRTPTGFRLADNTDDFKKNLQSAGGAFGFDIQVTSIENGLRLNFEPTTTEAKMRIPMVAKAALEFRQTTNGMYVTMASEFPGAMGILDFVPVSGDSEQFASSARGLEKMIGLTQGACQLM